MLIRSRDFRTRDIYIDYPFEGAKFRWDRDTQTIYRRFYGKAESAIAHDSDMFNQAIAAGKEITRDEYFDG